MIGQKIVKKLKGTNIYWGLTETNNHSYIQIGDKTFECDDSFDKNKIRKMTRQANKYINEILKKGN